MIRYCRKLENKFWQMQLVVLIPKEIFYSHYLLYKYVVVDGRKQVRTWENLGIGNNRSCNNRDMRIDLNALMSSK